jgi:hypothetical protein
MSEAYASQSGGDTIDHSAWDALLKRHVNERGGVDYAGLMGDREQLHEYIGRLSRVDSEALGRDEKLALLLNAYNAFTVELILENWQSGRLQSIRDIPSAERWDDARWQVGSQVWSLNDIEHEQIRPKFADARIHFALVCAAVGCPPLRSEAYTADQMETQLREQAAYVHRHGRWFLLDGDGQVLHLTQLYDWYGGDFAQAAGSVLEFASRYSRELRDSLDARRAVRIEWLDYDWALNSQENLP